MKEACAYIETIRNLKSFIRLRELKSIIEEKQTIIASILSIGHSNKKV
jgi:hypothetical protein